MDPAYIPVGDYYVSRITHDSLESDVREAWSAILSDVFSYYDGFSISHEANIQNQRIDMKVSRLANRSLMNFLVLELKRSSYANSKDALRDAEDQLLGYLASLGGTDRGKLWGALCIGKNVQFEKVNVEFGQFELEILHAEMLRIDRQPQTVTEYLQYIKSHAS